MFKHALRKVGLVAVGALTMFGSLAIDAAGASTKVTYHHIAVLSCSSVRLERPTRYTLGCGNGTYVLSQVKWTTWGGASATGTAVYTLNTCSPNCAAGNHVSYNTAITANAVRKIKSGYIYKKILLVYKNHGHPARVLWTLPPM